MSIRLPAWARKRSASKSTESLSPFRAVAITPGWEGACPRVKSYAGKRFLARSAPALPLKDCDYPTCTCRYVKFDDRRQEPRRGSEYGIANNFVRDVERRAGRSGRRKTD